MEFVLALIGQIFVAGAIYGAMRADLKAMNEKIIGAHVVASRAHERIDLLLNGRQHG